MNIKNLREIIDFCDECETRWEGEELLIWILHPQVQESCELFSKGVFHRSGGYKVQLQDYWLCVDLVPFLEYEGIDPGIILEN